ncbi:hypothetical protein PsAD46_01674 [Pseudovibrio sp. Ad46]|nr:hypothetical protein PsAD46_01674 [Pseudovibrio sp. Ad46]
MLNQQLSCIKQSLLNNHISKYYTLKESCTSKKGGSAPSEKLTGQRPVLFDIKI